MSEEKHSEGCRHTIAVAWSRWWINNLYKHDPEKAMCSEAFGVAWEYQQKEIDALECKLAIAQKMAEALRVASNNYWQDTTLEKLQKIHDILAEWDDLNKESKE